jgi:hypothetical protein
MAGNLEQKNGPFQDYKVSQMTVKIKFWYKLNGEKGELVQYGHTPLVMKTKWGPSLDDDPEKKSLSDAIKKSLTMLGFCADVFLGKFEDVSYLNELRQDEEEAAKKEQEEKLKTVNNEINKIVKDAELNYQACTTQPAINGMCKTDVSDINRLCKKINKDPAPALEALKLTVQKRREEIKNV